VSATRADERWLNGPITTSSTPGVHGAFNETLSRETDMNKQQEKVLVATLCGLVVAAAGAFAVQPAMAAGYQVDQLAKVTGVAHWDHLNVRKWPASYSQKVGAFEPGRHVWVERCIDAEAGSDWCLVDAANTRGWVNSRYLTVVHNWDH
jgi:uncharacterized protein YraI